jgi:N-acyl homoserine lactone hydrolase
MRRFAPFAAAAALLVLAACASPSAAVRLYVFDCGRLNVEDPSRFDFKPEELAVLDLSVPCYLVQHPKGTLMWDTGVVPDDAFPADGGPGVREYATAAKKLLPQLAEAGFAPEAITYLAVSHAHWDHIGNAAAFAASTWLVRREERDAILATPSPVRTQPAMFDPLRTARFVEISAEDYDVFGDGAVVIKHTPGHTAGHQVLFVKLANTGPVVLSGDLYHYPEELRLSRVPLNEPDKAATLASRRKLEAFLKETGAQLWIQHDYATAARQKKAPRYYD